MVQLTVPCREGSSLRTGLELPVLLTPCVQPPDRSARGDGGRLMGALGVRVLRQEARRGASASPAFREVLETGRTYPDTGRRGESAVNPGCLGPFPCAAPVPTAQGIGWAEGTSRVVL